MSDSITCPQCGRTSYHPMDIKEGYCGACHDYTSQCTWCFSAENITVINGYRACITHIDRAFEVVLGPIKSFLDNQ